jgi:regulator of protease activity HflC (stomatin/prohibitin superfamily)
VTVIAAAVLLTLLLGVGFAGPSSVSTGPDQVALHYKDGAFSSRRFADCIGSSTRVWDGPGDRHFVYPTSQTNFVFGEGGDGSAITFVTKDGIEMTVTGVANMILNTECDALRSFHDLIGNRYAAYMEGDLRTDGWRQVLSIYVARPLDTAIDRAGQNYTYADLYTNPGVKAQWEADVVAALPELVNRQTDGEVSYFLNFAVTLQKPEPPQPIKDALVAQQEAVARAKALEAEADAKQKAAEAQIAVERAEAAKILERIKVLGRDGYLRQYAIDHGLNPYQPSTGSLITGNGN